MLGICLRYRIVETVDISSLKPNLPVQYFRPKAQVTEKTGGRARECRRLVVLKKEMPCPGESVAIAQWLQQTATIDASTMQTITAPRQWSYR